MQPCEGAQENHTKQQDFHNKDTVTSIIIVLNILGLVNASCPEMWFPVVLDLERA